MEAKLVHVAVTPRELARRIGDEILQAVVERPELSWCTLLLLQAVVERAVEAKLVRVADDAARARAANR